MVLHSLVKMRQIELLAQIRTVSCIVVYHEESWVNVVERWGGVLALAWNRTTIDVMQENVKFMRLVGITMVVVKNVLALLATHPISDTNWFGAFISGRKGWGKIKIWL